MDIKKSWLFTKPIAHRGLHNDVYPENSIGAFGEAIKNNYPIETDVRMIDDGNVIVFHDDKLSRLTDRDGYSANLKTEDLKNINLLKTQETIPTFKEMLDFVDGRVPILVEIKNSGNCGELEKKVLELLKEYKGEYAVQSFNPYSMEYFKENSPSILRGQLSAFFPKTELTFMKRFALKRLMMNRVSCPDFISYEFEALPNKYVTKTKLPVLAWTIRSNGDIEKVKPYCDNIIFEKFIPELN